MLEDKGGKPWLKYVSTSVRTNNFSSKGFEVIGLPPQLSPVRLGLHLPSALFLRQLGGRSVNRRGILSSQSRCTLGSSVPLVCTLLLASCPPPAFRDLELKSQHWSVSRGRDEYPTLLKSLTVSHGGRTPVEAGGFQSVSVPLVPLAGLSE